MINIRMQQKEVKLSPKIIVVGVGGAGGNAVNNMIGAGLEGVDFLVCNTDAQALEGSRCDTKMQLGATVTSGLGAGARPEVGREAAEESLDQLLHHLEGANMAFITAGMGGGTGTGAAPVIAKAAREKGILTVGVVTKPFHFEGTYRMKMAEAGIDEMQDFVDTLIVIPNQNLFRIANEKTTFAEAFRMADGVLQAAVRGVTDLMVRPGLINLDFADIRSVMMEMGKAMMGTGEAMGDDRAEHAAEAAINNPLLDDVSMKGARGVIVNVTGGPDMTLFEVDQACNRIRDEVDPNANIIIGSTFDDSLEGIMRVSVVATGIDAVEEKGRKTPPATRVVNAVAQPQARTERQQPTTEQLNRVEMPQVQAAAQMAQTQQYAQRQPMPAAGYSQQQQPAAYTQHAPSAVYAPQAPSHAGAYAVAQQQGSLAMARRPDDQPDQALFEQRDAIEKKPEAAGGASGNALRGSVFKDAFIPPQPVEVEKSRVDAAYTGVSLSARRSETEQAAQAQEQEAAAFAVRPSVPGLAVHRKRAASLFERLTGPLRDGRDERTEAVVTTEVLHADVTETVGVQSPVTPAAPVGSFHASAPRQKPDAPLASQGSLAIDTPSIKAEQSADDELDIPAFLRRQAN